MSTNSLKSEKKKESSKKKRVTSVSKVPTVDSLIKKMVNLCNKKNLSFKDQMRIDMYEKTIKMMLQREKNGSKNDEKNSKMQLDAKNDVLNALSSRKITTLPTLSQDSLEENKNE